ncbi:hypothetical protein CNR22_09240 [Sphingobacteriaceae bacterium]|nr:hypothetical protein CNR22_09240 [Sphingobacteriaceae bacterium]
MKTLSFFVLLLCTNAVFAQKADVNYYSTKYPNTAYINLDKSENTNISITKGALEIVQHHHEEFMILKSTLNSVRSKKVYTSSFIKVKNLTAFIHIYNGKTHKKEKITSIHLESENDNDATFYDDNQSYTISFLEAKEGDIIEVDYDQLFVEPRFFDVTYFSNYSPVIHSKSTVTYPINLVNFKIREINNQSLALNFRADSTKKTKTLSWSADSILPLTSEYLDASYRYKASYILMAIESYKSADSVVKLAGSLENLYSWYRFLIKNVDISTDDYLVSLTDSLLKNCNSDLEKTKQLFYWVQNKIAYLAYEDGLGGYVPREASVVCKRRFGDCKDMANLIVKMGHIAKLPIYPAWIGTRDIPYQFSEFPVPFCANHMIAAYISKTDTIFLDGTGKSHPFRLPTSMIQGKEALIGIDNMHFAIAKVPFIEKERTIEHDSVILTLLPNNRIEGLGYYQLTGYEKVTLSNYLDKKSYQLQKNYLKAILEKGNNKFKLDTFYITQHELEKPLLLCYKFVISDYVTQTGEQTFINLNFFKDYFDKLNMSKRKNAIDFDYKTIRKLTVAMKLDENYSIEYIPENTSFSTAVMGYELNYKVKDQTLYFTNAISIDRATIYSEDFKEVNHIVSNYKKTKSNLVSLTTKK